MISTKIIFDTETATARGGAQVRFGALLLAFGITAPEHEDVRGASKFGYKLESLNGLPAEVLTAWAQTFAVSLELERNRSSYSVECADDLYRGARALAEVI